MLVGWVWARFFGPMVSMGQIFARFKEAIQPEARRAFLIMGRAWAKISGPTIGLGQDFLRQALFGPAREMLRYTRDGAPCHHVNSASDSLAEAERKLTSHARVCVKLRLLRT
jgi:hypothetical protein